MKQRSSHLLKHVAPGPLAMGLCIAAPVVAAALFFVWTRVTTIQLGYALSQATRTQSRLLAERDSLRLDVAALKSPERLSKLAAERGLQPATPDRIVVLRER